MPEQINILEKSVNIPAGTKIPGRANCVLKHSIQAQVASTKDGYVISSDFFADEAYGTTYPESISDFLASLYDRLQSLSRRENKLSSEDKEVLRRLRASLQI